MRTAFALALLCACSAPAPEPRYITIGSDALETARAVVAQRGEALSVLDVTGDAAILAVNDTDLEALSEQMHERHDRCGGFMLHESLDEARAALQPPPRAAAIDYTLDQAALVREILPDLSAARILETIRELSSMKNRYYQSESGAAASVWLRDRWKSFAVRPDVTVELFDHGYAQKSVILTIPGTTRASEVVVIGGHLDSIAIGGKTSRAPGADDDASGIATLTEVARVLLSREMRPARTVQLMAYAAEEVGLRGSLSIAREYKKRNINVVGALQLDMTNYQGSDKDIWLINDFTDAAQNAFLGRLIDAYVGATWGTDACGYACSDHASWNRFGVPASMPFESRSDQRNRMIHTHKDTLETSGNNADHAVKFARLATAYAIEMGKTAASAPAVASSASPIPSAPMSPAAMRSAADPSTAEQCCERSGSRTLLGGLSFLLILGLAFGMRSLVMAWAGRSKAD